MNDFFKEFKKQEEINEGLFKNIFGKKAQQSAPLNGPKIIENSDNTISIKFENGSFAKEVNTLAALPYLKRLDFNAGNLNFLNLPGTKFNANYLELDLKTQQVKIFMGDWFSGPFNGGHFEGRFNGSSFNGSFVGSYVDWEAHPTKFVDGTFLDATNSGLLGSPNIVTLPANVSNDTHLIFMPEGQHLQFRSKNGVSGYIKTLKRLDSVNSDFQYEVLNGFTDSSPKILNLTWTQIRQSWNTLFIDPKNTKNLAGIIKVPEGDEIVEIYISAAPATFKSPSIEFNPNSIYNFSLSKIPYLYIYTIKGAGGKFVKSEIGLKFDSKQEFDKYQEIVSYINSGVFKQDVKDINKAIKYGEIDGYGPYNYLKFVFNNIQGTKLMPSQLQKSKKTFSEAKGTLDTVKFKAPAIDKYASMPSQSADIQYGHIPAMERMNDFVKYFVENIVLKSGAPNTPVQNMVISRLKTAFGVEPMIKAPVGPGVASNSDLDVEKTFGQPGIKEESVRNSIRNIMKDNF